MTSFIKKIFQSEFLRNVATLISATSISQAIALAIYPVLTRIYSPAEHGLFALYLSIISVTAVVSTGRYELSVMLPKKDKEGAGLTVIGLFLSFIFSIFLLGFIFVFKGKIPLWFKNPDLKSWLFFIPLSTFLVGSFQLFSNWSNRKKDYKLMAKANLGQSLVNSAVKLSTSKTIGKGGGLITGVISGQVFGVIIFLVRIYRKSREFFVGLKFRTLFQLAGRYNYFPRFNMPHSLTNNFSASLPVFIINSFFSAEYVGLYSLGFMMIHKPMNMISMAFSQVFSQKFIESYNHGKLIAEDIRKLMKHLFLISIVPFIMAAIFGPKLFSVVFGNEWHEAGIYMRIFVPWLIPVFLLSPFTFLPDMLARQKKALIIDLIKIILRTIALFIGVIYKDIYLSLIFLSGISFIMAVYTLFWYLNLSKLADSKSSGNMEVIPYLPEGDLI